MLDEPFEAVDPVSAATIKTILRGFVAGGGSIVLSRPDRSATITVDWLTGAVEMTSGGGDDAA